MEIAQAFENLDWIISGFRSGVIPLGLAGLSFALNAITR